MLSLRALEGNSNRGGNCLGGGDRWVGRWDRVAIYARVSTSDQSTDSQLLDLRRYVRERGWELFKEFCDSRFLSR